jgi:hypothetical protein
MHSAGCRNSCIWLAGSRKGRLTQDNGSLPNANVEYNGEERYVGSCIRLSLSTGYGSWLFRVADSSKPFTLRSPAQMTALATSTPSSSSSSAAPSRIVEKDSASKANLVESGTVKASSVDSSKDGANPTVATSAVAAVAKPESASSSSTTTEATPEGDGEENNLTTKDEESIEMFSEMLTQARSLRDEAQRGGLADDERRRRAADMAMRLCAMMNMDESDDEEDE